jgi:hypothetical protein
MSSETTTTSEDGSSPTAASSAESMAAGAPARSDTENSSAEPLPPMTTEWNVPQSCTWTYNAASEPVPGATGAVAWLDLEPDAEATTLSCYPDGMFKGERTGVFSPGTCPRWTTAEVLVNTDEDHDHATTTAICCSSEYSLVDTICKRSVPTVLAVPISYNKTASTHEVLSDSTTTLYSATIAVYTIMAMFRESDKPMLGIGDEDDIDDEDRSSGLSINEKIGIGVGSAIGGLLVIAGAIFLFLHCRRRKRRANGTSHEMGAVHRNCRGVDRDDDASFTSAEDDETRRRSYGHEPPPAYEATTETNSLADTESGTSASREEIRVLRAQKELIQRRINELESVETDDGVELPQQQRLSGEQEQTRMQQEAEPQNRPDTPTRDERSPQ